MLRRYDVDVMNLPERPPIRRQFSIAAAQLVNKSPDIAGGRHRNFFWRTRLRFRRWRPSSHSCNLQIARASVRHV